MDRHGSESQDLDSWDLVFPFSQWELLRTHLFPGDNDEHGAVVLAGLSTLRGRTRILVRHVLLAADGKDYVPGQLGYRALSPLFIANAARRAQREGLIYLAAHCHGGWDRVAFSSIDLASHERGYPALSQLIGRPVGGLVFARAAAAGDLWLEDGNRTPLARTIILGTNVAVLGEESRRVESTDPMFDRQARVLGDKGQVRLQGLRVGVVGLGGAGSMAAEMLA